MLGVDFWQMAIDQNDFDPLELKEGETSWGVIPNIACMVFSKIKQKLVRDLTPLLKSYLDFELAKIGKNNCFHLFVLKK